MVSFKPGTALELAIPDENSERYVEISQVRKGDTVLSHGDDSMIHTIDKRLISPPGTLKFSGKKKLITEEDVKEGKKLFIQMRQKKNNLPEWMKKHWS
ncbi:hypothetical protein KHC33_04940 [Methanospirillum sp. J.3.6.1-F.2.7.3]|uniref:Uncharacterized protein n=1 Tax=Methanospirillum purgamenti TaxID=2834276 RepID=A0A8E7EI83_9EURY|nr:MULTISPECIES: hypothetical protein [Methanospirillum]MDX8551981.1 hypothetical protein [Methanospirillum hungatei]QVV89847.1 hypothetical protein KHC33_04940 [Methanospirillum sp. J.3.6.1-F.2.7.3]